MARLIIDIDRQFLKHLSRTRLLLHLVDLQPPDGHDPLEDIQKIEAELAKFGGELAERERWLVPTKKDLLPAEDFAQLQAELVDRLHWEGPVFAISSVTGEGTRELVNALMARLAELRPALAETAPAKEDASTDDEPYDPLKG